MFECINCWHFHENGHFTLTYPSWKARLSHFICMNIFREIFEALLNNLRSKISIPNDVSAHNAIDMLAISKLSVPNFLPFTRKHCIYRPTEIVVLFACLFAFFGDFSSFLIFYFFLLFSQLCANRLTHPNIVQLLETYEDKNKVYLIMEL